MDFQTHLLITTFGGWSVGLVSYLLGWASAGLIRAFLRA
jgi:hypothetical protein